MITLRLAGAFIGIPPASASFIDTRQRGRPTHKQRINRSYEFDKHKSAWNLASEKFHLYAKPYAEGTT